MKIFYTPSLLLESFKPFVGVFLKKFIKFSHKTGFISLVISFILRNSVCTCFSAIFLSYNCYYEKYSDGTIKNIQDEIPFDLPDSWSWERLSNLAAFSGGKTPSTSNRDYWGGNILWVTSKDMKSKYIDSSLLMISEKSLEQMQLYPENTLLLVTRSGILRHTIPVAILKKPATINQDLKAIMPYALNLGEYIYICIKGMESRLILEYTKAGATVENINFDAFQKILLPIPPENQIQRIVLAVNKVDEIIVKLKIDQDDLIDIIGKTKSKILEFAIQGKLVPQDENDEPASILLERIHAERKAKLGKKYVESYIYKGDDNCYYENNNGKVLLVNDFLPFDLPEGWAYVRLENVLNYEQPTEYIVESTDYKNEYKTPVLTAGKSFIIGYTNETTGIKNDLPVIIFDDFTTDSKYVDFPFKVKSSAMKILTADKSLIDTKYAYYIMQTVECDHETHKRYWISEYGRIIIGLPPLNEQLKITSQIEYLFSLLDNGKEP